MYLFIILFYFINWITATRHKSERYNSNLCYWGVTYYIMSHVTATLIPAEKINIFTK